MTEGTIVEDIDAPVLYTSFANIGVRHHIGEGWSVGAQLPVGMVTLEPAPGIPTERATGLGDLQLAGRYDLQALWGRGDLLPSVSLKLGVGLPTGTQTRLAGDIIGLEPSIVTLGWGAFALSASLETTWFVMRNLAIMLPVGVRVPLSRNTEGFLFGPVLNYGLGVLVVANEVFSVAASASGVHRSVSNQETNGELLNSGGDKLSADLSVLARLNDHVAIGARGGIPFWQQVNGTQVVETWSFGAFLSLTFSDDDDDEDEHDHHDHDGHDHHDHDGHGHGPDVSDLAKGGQTFLLGDAIVKGKVSVVDFWADWCAPCHEITERLTSLAKRHSDLAVRRVEVPDFDTKVAKIHLPGINALPVVWIYDRQGREVAVLQSPTPDQVIEAVEEALAAGGTE